MVLGDDLQTKSHTSLLASKRFQSEIIEITNGESIIIDVSYQYRHWFAGVIPYDDAQGSNILQPSAGKYTFSILTPMQPNGYQSFQNNVLRANTPSQVNWASNTDKVKVVISDISTTLYLKLMVFGNIS
jgi:hypothetical protein